MKAYLYENEVHRDLEPLNRITASCDLLCGYFSFRERDRRIHGEDLHPDVLLPGAEIPGSGMQLFINSTAFYDGMPQSTVETVWKSGDRITAAMLRPENAEAWALDGFRDGHVFAADVSEAESPWGRADKPWDLIEMNGDRVVSDADLLDFVAVSGDWPGVHRIGDYPLKACPGITVYPGTVLDTGKGPVIIDEGVEIGAGSVLQGPLVIRRGSVISARSVLRPGTTVGTWCKVGGEVSNTIFLGYSNKSHDGFVGTSYIGRWCNLGAGTNVSNLKNNYSSVSVWNRGRSVDSGRMFQGMIMADHCRTAIGTRINTGTVFDVGCNIFCDGFPMKYVPPFSWGGEAGSPLYALDKFLETASKAAGRRGTELPPKELEILGKIHASTALEESRKKD